RAPTALYTLSLHDALPIWSAEERYAPDRSGQRLAARPRIPTNLPQVQEEPLGSRDAIRRRDAAAFLQLRGRLVGVTWPQRIVCPDRKSTRLNSSHVSISYA